MARLERRQLVKTGTLSAGVLLVAALLVFVNYFGFKYYKRFDWTGSRLYTLSEKTRNVLKDLRRDVDVVVFLPPAQNLYEPTKELLARYSAASSRIHVRLVDPEKNPVETERLVRQYNVSSPGVVLASGTDRRVIDSNDLGEFDYSGMQFGQQPQMTGFKGEQLITSGLLQLAEGRKPKVLFTNGHGEHTLDDNGPRGLSGAQELLGRDNFDIQEWASLGKAAIPPGTDLVVVAGPTGTFVKPELDALTAYVDGGGRLLVLLDPTIGPSGQELVTTGLEAWLSGYGVKVGSNIVVDPSNPLPFFGSETIAVKDYGEHPITKPLKQGNLPILMSLLRSIGGSVPAGVSGLTATELMKTSAQGWGETDLAHLEKVTRDPSDLPGPVSLGVAIERKGPAAPGAPAARPARLVVFGDSDFATNQLLQANVANSVLLSDSLNWLVEREALLGIPPKKTEQVHLSLTQQQLRIVYLLTLVLLPGLAVSGGVFVHFRRRR